MISVPLVTSDEIVGTLNCYTRHEHKFGAAEVALLTMLADQAAIAIITSRLRADQARTITDLNSLNESLEAQYELQRKAASFHDKLTALALDGGGVPAITDALSDALIRPVAIRSVAGSLLHVSDDANRQLPEAVVVESDWLERGVFPITDDSTTGPSDVSLTDQKTTQTAIRVPVLLKEEVVAWIWTTGRLTDLRPFDRQAIQHTATVLALELLRERSTAEAEWRDAGEILSGLLLGLPHETRAFVAQAARFGLDLSKLHAVVVIRCDLVRGLPSLHQLSATFQRIARSRTPKPLLGIHDGYVVALWPLTSPSLDEAQGISHEIRSSLAGRGSEATEELTAIIGPVTYAAEYPEAFTTARGALEIAAMNGLEGQTLTLHDLGITGLLLQVPNTSALKIYTDEITTPLREYDQAHGTSLLQTLRILMRHDLDVRATAEEMVIHKNTVLQRRKRIEELLSLSMGRISTLAHISNALKVEEVLRAGSR